MDNTREGPENRHPREFVEERREERAHAGAGEAPRDDGEDNETQLRLRQMMGDAPAAGEAHQEDRTKAPSEPEERRR